MKIVSRTDSRVRIKFDNEFEKISFLKNMKEIPGIKELKERKALSVIINYEPNSPFEYILKNLKETKEEPKAGKDEIYHYGNVVLTHPVAKALWTMTWLGAKRGFLTFAICSMGVNRYLKAKFE
jgi:hypothetical protein